jgi:diacylglycerol kinase family enzyme
LIAPEAKIDDGLLHYAMIRSVSRPMMFRLLPEVMKGTHGRFEAVTIGTCKHLSVTADRPMYIHADGEIYTSFGSNLRRLDFDILPGALKVVRG